MPHAPAVTTGMKTTARKGAVLPEKGFMEPAKRKGPILQVSDLFRASAIPLIFPPVHAPIPRVTIATVVPGSSNTTVPTPEDPSSSSPGSSARSRGARVVPALFLAWSFHQPDRAGEVALFDPFLAGPFFLGREKEGEPARTHFSQLLPGETIDGGPLVGDNISGEQFRVTVEGDALRLQNTGKARVRVNGTELPRGAAVLLRPGDVVEVHGNCVLLVGRSPLSFPPPPAVLLPLPPSGEAGRLGIVGASWRAQQLREDVVLAALSGRHAFVQGPTGTGKELVARAIHELSPRAGRPFVTANGASFTAGLAALELFGNPATSRTWARPSAWATSDWRAAARFSSTRSARCCRPSRRRCCAPSTARTTAWASRSPAPPSASSSWPPTAARSRSSTTSVTGWASPWRRPRSPSAARTFPCSCARSCSGGSMPARRSRRRSSSRTHAAGATSRSTRR